LPVSKSSGDYNFWEQADVRSGGSVNLYLVRGFGDIRLMAEDDKTLVVGVTEAIPMANATLTAVQKPSTGGDTPWKNKFVHVEKGTLVVTAIGLNGFYVTDTEASEYNHLYVYTRGIPDLDRGYILRYVAGTVDEFYKLTELSFPDYEWTGKKTKTPCPIELTASVLGSDDEMEKLEGALVAIKDVMVDKENFFPPSFDEYGQWAAVTLTGGRITVATQGALPEFYPLEFSKANKRFKRMVGNVRQHSAADPEFILAPRDECDVWLDEPQSEACTEYWKNADCGY